MRLFETYVKGKPDQHRTRSWLHRPPVRLSVRALMTIVLISGSGLGWIAYRARVQREAVAAIEGAGGQVFYDRDVSSGVLATPGTTATWREWLVDRIGPGYFGNVTSVFLQGERGAPPTTP